MAETPSTLSVPLVVSVNEQQLAHLLRDQGSAPMILLVVENLHEDNDGAALHFRQGGQGRLELSNANYGRYLKWAKRSHERGHPVGVQMGEGSIIHALARADNDVPLQMGEERTADVPILFQGHDGVFRLSHNHPEYSRIRELLEEAIVENVRVWFLPEKPSLSLLDVQSIAWTDEPKATPVHVELAFVMAPDPILKIAEEILQANLPTTENLRQDIWSLAHAYLDEAEKRKRAVRDVQTNAAFLNPKLSSPSDMIANAKHLQAVDISEPVLQDKVRVLAKSYVLIAEENQKRLDDFKEKYREDAPISK